MGLEVVRAGEVRESEHTALRLSVGTGVEIRGLDLLKSPLSFALQHPQWEQPQRCRAHLWDDHVSGQVSP